MTPSDCCVRNKLTSILPGAPRGGGEEDTRCVVMWGDVATALYVTSQSGHFRILPYGGCHRIALCERK